MKAKEVTQQSWRQKRGGRFDWQRCDSCKFSTPDIEGLVKCSQKGSTFKFGVCVDFEAARQ